MITPNQYINIGGISLSDQVYPVYYKPIVTTNDYGTGYINRYFVQKINDLSITEVNQDKFNEISDLYYNKLVIEWVITGPKNNQYKNKILERKGVQEQNTKTLNDNNSKMKGLKTYINNPLEFWGGK